MPPLSFSSVNPHALLQGWRSIVVGLSLIPATSLAQVRLNEIVARTNERLLMADGQGRQRPGSGPFWADPGFAAPGWLTGNAPLGFGGASGLGTNVGALMQNRTPNLYIRRVVDLSAAQAANEGQLQLKVKFDDGFIAFLNGQEVARANAGPAGHFVYADQKAYNFAATTTNSAYNPATQTGTALAAPGTGITYPLGRVQDFLTEGSNVLALQLINREPGTSARIDAQLEIIPATAVLDVVRESFNDANDSAEVHRNLGGNITYSSEGTLPVNSWLHRAPPAQSDPAWADLTLHSTLAANLGYQSSGALQYSYSQTDPANSPASFRGPVLPLGSRIPAGPLTPDDLQNLRLSFRFRATSNTAYDIRLDPDGQSPGSSLTGLTLAPGSGTGPTQDAPDIFSDALGGLRTRTVSASGSGSTTTSGTLRNTLTPFNGSAMRSASFSITEDNTAGSGTDAAPGALRFQMITPAATPDIFGFTYQSVSVRSWTPGSVTPEQLASGALQFDYQLPAGGTWQVFLESASGVSTAADRLGLGSITGTGSWQTAILDTGTASNQTAFLSFINSISTNAVRVVFLQDEVLPAGSTLWLDNIGYAAWRTYNTALSTGTNQAAFLAAINAMPVPGFVPVFEKTGIAAAPDKSTLTMDDFGVTLTKPNAGSAAVLTAYGASAWQYFPGLAEPSGGVVETADFNVPQGTGEYGDWVELFNSGSAPVNLSNWSLTDSASNPDKYIFPAGTVINAGAALVIMADNRAAPPGAVYLHAPFSLASDGEFVGLYNASRELVDALDSGFPEQDSFHSWGRDPSGNAWGFLRHATPGQANSGPWRAAQSGPPVFSMPGGFYTGSITLSLSSPTPGSQIRYTIDGSEPTATSGTVYTAPFSLSVISDRIGHVIRARTFGQGLVPSPTVTHSYLINQHNGIRSAPAVLLAGESGRTFYKPQGIFAIQGGTYNSSIWKANGPNDYNMPVGDGRLTDPDSSSRPYERHAYLEFLYPDNRPGLREDVGVRVSSSPYSRPRLVLSDPPSKTLWDANATLKPSINVFFRDDYGSDSINFPLIPETEVREFSEFRLRAGKNDISNPFIRDEFIRRLYTDMGHEGTVGTFVSVYLNGYFKGYYNLVERIREAFMQGHYRSNADWDVNYIGTFENGDNVHWNTVLQPRLNANLTVKSNWDALLQVLDVTNVADYILLNTYTAMWDWPHNNWAMARERSATGLWRCYVWDAEGGFNMGGKGQTHQTLNLDLLASGANSPIPTMFRRLMTSPEFRLLFADRIQRHLFNNGALTDARMSTRRSTTQAEVSPLMAIAGINPDTAWFNNWINPTSGRRVTLFPRISPAAHGQFRDPNQDNNLSDTLWPVTTPPVFSQHGGLITPGSQISISHSAPDGSTLYYTIDGSDPRNWGGTVAPTALVYAGPITLSGSSVTVATRVRNASTNEWSPLTEARFAQATVPATAANIVIAEIMYNPPALTTAESTAGYLDEQEFEYIVLQNIGSAPVDLTALRFQLGITFNFDATRKPVVDPGQRALLAKNAAALRLRYGPGIDAVLAGEYFGSLANGGEMIRLEVAANGSPIKNFTFSDGGLWPASADGGGSSLMLVNSATNPDPDLPSSWTASSSPGGSPTGVPLTLNYDQWAGWIFKASERADPTRTGPGADFENDGLPNLVEYLTGTNPRIHDDPLPLLPEVIPGAGGTHLLRMTFPTTGSTSGYQLVVQSSANLSTWSGGFTLVGSVPSANGSVIQTWEKPLPASVPKQFMRLQALPR